jgi:hypothetical protein
VVQISARTGNKFEAGKREHVEKACLVSVAFAYQPNRVFGAVVA